MPLRWIIDYSTLPAITTHYNKSINANAIWKAAPGIHWGPTHPLKNDSSVNIEQFSMPLAHSITLPSPAACRSSLHPRQPSLAWSNYVARLAFCLPCTARINQSEPKIPPDPEVSRRVSSHLHQSRAMDSQLDVFDT